MVTKAGLPVLGDGGPIVIDPARGPITVADDGNISQDGVAIGQLPGPVRHPGGPVQGR